MLGFRRHCVTVAIAAAVGLGVLAGPITPSVSVPARLVFTQIPRDSDGDSIVLPTGSRIVIYDPSHESGSLTVLTPAFASAGRSDMSFDGRRILFVGKKGADDPPSVWEIGVDGTGLRQVTTGPGHCIAAVYLSTIYTMTSVKPEFQVAVCVRQEPGDAPAVYTCRLDGTALRRITFAPNGAFDPAVLSDGRLLFSDGASSLFTVNTDGTDVFIFAESETVPAMPFESGNREVVFVENRSASRGGGGRLIGVSSMRSLHTRRVIKDVADGAIASPAALGNDRLIVSYRSNDASTFGIYWLDRKSGVAMTPIFDSPDWHEVFARPIGPRSVPAGRSSSVKDDRSTGVLYCLDAYLTGTTRTDERIARVRVMGSPVRTDGGGVPRGDTLLGEIAVESDGSFAMQVPARTPMRLITLNTRGDVLREMRSWLWVMPNENRGCIGCHEDRELTPPNRFVRALRIPPRPLARDRGSTESQR